MAEETNTVVFDDAVDITTVAELKENLRQCLEQGGEVIFDAEKIERIDTAALQLLTAFLLDAGVKGINIQWDSPSEALINAVAQLGLEKFMHVSGNA